MSADLPLVGRGPDPDDDQDAWSAGLSEYGTSSTVPGRQAPVMEMAVPRPRPAAPDIPLALSLPDAPTGLVPDINNSPVQTSPPEPVPSELPLSPLVNNPSYPVIGCF